mgnify:CR=1 FL=1
MKLPMMIAALVLSAMLPAANATNPQANVDPLDSARWEEMQKTFLTGHPFVFDPQVKVTGPADAENPLQVPVTVDATALGKVEEVVVFADFNPIVQILRFYPGEAAAYLGFRVKLQQSSPVRAAVRTKDGVWHVGGTWVNTVGGGCSSPSVGTAMPAWQKQLNNVSARQWRDGELAGRLRLRVVHPMDTGLVSGIPAFHLQEIRLTDSNDQLLMRIETFEPVSENPVFTVQQQSAGRVRASGRDNNGNIFSVWID